MRVVWLADGFVDLHGGTVHRGAEWVALSPIEHRLVDYLSRRPGQIVERDELLTEVWEYRPGVRSRTIDNTARRLREKIEPDPSNPVHLVAVYGRGLMLEAEVGERDVEADAGASRFVGRDDELASLDRAWAAGARVVLVRGPGGAGKTRLVAELARKAGWPIVDLAGAADRADVDGRVASMLEVPTPRVLTALAAVPVVVLDRCEGAADAVARWVAAVMPEVPSLRVLATSRGPLGIGEEVVTLGPLPIAAAIELFCDRARQHAPKFRLAPTDRTHLVHLLDAIDRLPLAVEIAAARASIGLHHLARMVDWRLELLGGDDSRGMRATLRWSVDSLPAGARESLSGLAVFEGPFTLEDAEKVLGVANALDRVHGLFERSLGYEVPTGSGRTRYALYELVRDAVRESIPPRPEAIRRHAVWFARLGDPEHLDRGHREAAARAAIGDAEAELRRVVEGMWSAAPDLAGRAAVALLTHFVRTYQFDAGTGLVHRLGDLGCTLDVRGSILIVACNLDLVSRGGQTLTLASRGLSLPLRPIHLLHLRLLRARALATAGRADESQRDLDACAELMPSASSLLRGTYHRFRAALHLAGFRLDPAERELRAALAAYADHGAGSHQAVVMGMLAHVAAERGRWDEAEAGFRDAVRTGTEVGWQARSKAGVHRDWATLERYRGRLAESFGHLDEAERLLREVGGGPLMDTVVGGRALTLAFAGRPVEAMAALDARLLSTEPQEADYASALYGAAATVRYRLGNYAGARAAIEVAIDLTLAAGDRIAHHRLIQGLIDGHFGERDLGRQRIAAALAELAGSGVSVSLLRGTAISALFEARFGDLATARDALDRVTREVESLGIGPEAEAGWWIELAEEAASSALAG